MSMSRPQVSVVIPAYNASQYICGTLESVLRQTHSDLEVLVIDDGSTDETWQAAAAIAKRDRRIQLRRQERGGVAAARNHGIAQARGEWIAPLDADDLWHEDKIQKQLATFERSPASLGLVYTWTTLIDEAGQLLRRQMSYCWEGDVFIPLLLWNIVGHGSGPLIRRSCFDRVGSYSTEFFPHNAQGCEDWDLYLRIARRFEFAVVPEYLVNYRLAPQSMSHQYRAMERSFRLMLQNVQAQVPGLPRDLIRWSASRFYFKLATESWVDGSFGNAQRCCLLSCAINPVRLLERRTYRMMAVSLLRRPLRSQELGTPSNNNPGLHTRKPQPLSDRRQEWVLARGFDWWQTSPSRCLTSLAARNCNLRHAH